MQALIDAVALEPGFPRHLITAPGLHAPSGLRRSCGHHGYSTGHQPIDESSPAVLTTLAAGSAALNAMWLAAADQFRPLLAATRGNGEDLTYSFVARRGGGAIRHVGSCAGRYREGCAARNGEYYWVRGGERKGGAFTYHTKEGHYETRGRICSCLASGKTHMELADCVQGDTAPRGRPMPDEL